MADESSNVTISFKGLKSETTIGEMYETPLRDVLQALELGRIQPLAELLRDQSFDIAPILREYLANMIEAKSSVDFKLVSAPNDAKISRHRQTLPGKIKKAKDDAKVGLAVLDAGALSGNGTVKAAIAKVADELMMSEATVKAKWLRAKERASQDAIKVAYSNRNSTVGLDFNPIEMFKYNPTVEELRERMREPDRFMQSFF